MDLQAHTDIEIIVYIICVFIVDLLMNYIYRFDFLMDYISGKNSNF